MDALTAVKGAMEETRRQIEKIEYFPGVLKCSWAEMALESGYDPMATFWALRRMLGSDEQQYGKTN